MFDNSQLADHVSDDDPLCDDYDDISILSDNELFKSVLLDDDYIHPSRSNCDSESLYYKQSSSKVHSLNKFCEFLTKFSIFRVIFTIGKNPSLADMVNRSFTQKEVQINPLQH